MCTECNSNEFIYNTEGENSKVNAKNTIGLTVNTQHTRSIDPIDRYKKRGNDYSSFSEKVKYFYKILLWSIAYG